jgi:hypothetical protein
VAGVTLGRTDVERQEFPLELEQLQRDAILGGESGKISSTSSTLNCVA